MLDRVIGRVVVLTSLAALGSTVLNHDDPYAPSYPLRKAQFARALIDGKEMYEALADALDNAQESVFLSFWHFNLHVYLRRRPGEPLRVEDRIDSILKRKAEQGVQIYVILWRENVPAVVNNFSQEMKRELNALHPNIHCIRHGHPTPFTVYFCHHQKFVVVDYNIAFVGESATRYLGW